MDLETLRTITRQTREQHGYPVFARPCVRCGLTYLDAFRVQHCQDCSVYFERPQTPWRIDPTGKTPNYFGPHTKTT
jgi:hypothetical protein